MPQVLTIQLRGGHPALDLINTGGSRDTPGGADALAEFSDLLIWAVRAGILTDAEAARLAGTGSAAGAAALERVKALRETLWRIFSSPAPAAAGDLALLSQAMAAAQAARRLTEEGHEYRWQWSGADADAVAHRVAVSACDLLTAPERARVHVCEGEQCGWLFLDTSRAGKRLFCSEESCGRRSRIKRWRRRHNA